MALTTARSNVDMIELSESMKFSAPIAQKFGLSVEDTAAAIGFLGNVGIKGTLAGTGLRRMMLGLTSQTGKAGKLFKALGISTVDATGNLRPMTDILAEFGEGLKKLPPGKRLAAIEAVFGKIGVTAAAEIIDQAVSGKLQDFTKQLQGAGGAAGEMAKTMNKGVVRAVRNMRSAFEALLIAVAESGLLKAFTDIAISITGVLRSMSKSNPELLKMVTIALALVAVFGPILAGLGFMVQGS